MRNTKEEKIDIINTIIDIWGNVNTNQILSIPIGLSLVGRDKYGISLHIEDYYTNHVTVVSSSDKNILSTEIMYYNDLPDYVINEILSALIKYDAEQMTKGF